MRSEIRSPSLGGPEPYCSITQGSILYGLAAWAEAEGSPRVKRTAYWTDLAAVAEVRPFQNCHSGLKSALQEDAGHLRAAYSGHAGKAQGLAPRL